MAEGRFNNVENEKASPNYRRHGAARGYTGYWPRNEIEDDSPLKIHTEKPGIQGYTGHIPNSRSPATKQNKDSFSPNAYTPPSTNSSVINNFQQQFRSFGQHLDIFERYNAAIQQLHSRQQSQELLLKIVRAKMSQRVNSYSEQLIHSKNLFESHDINGSSLILFISLYRHIVDHNH